MVLVKYNRLFDVQVSELPRTLFSHGVLDFRQIFGTDEYMRPILRLYERINGERQYVYPYDTFGNPVFPVCPMKTANMSEHDKYKPCPNHKFFGDGHYCVSYDNEGAPIFPLNKSGNPVVPVTRDGCKSCSSGMGLMFRTQTMPPSMSGLHLIGPGGANLV